MHRCTPQSNTRKLLLIVYIDMDSPALATEYKRRRMTAMDVVRTRGRANFPKQFRLKKGRDYSTKGVLNFFFTGAFFSTTYCGRPSL
jgi:hypothetical protein